MELNVIEHLLSVYKHLLNVLKIKILFHGWFECIRINNNNLGSYALSTYYTSNTILSNLHELSCLIFITTLGGTYHYNIHFTNEEMEAGRK